MHGVAIRGQMLSYVARTVPLVLRARLRADGALVSTLPRRVSLRQIDLNRHMNQAQYPAVMEQGRADLLLRCGAWLDWRSQGINPVVAEQNIQYRRELKPLQRYRIDSRVTGTTGRFVVVEHHLLVGQRVHAKGVAHLLFVGPDGVMDGPAVAEAVQPYVTDGLAVQDWAVVG